MCNLVPKAFLASIPNADVIISNLGGCRVSTYDRENVIELACSVVCKSTIILYILEKYKEPKVVVSGSINVRKRILCIVGVKRDQWWFIYDVV